MLLRNRRPEYCENRLPDFPANLNNKRIAAMHRRF